METALDMGNQTIFNVKDPTVDDQGVNKGYVDKKFLPLSGGTMKNELSMGETKSPILQNQQETLMQQQKSLLLLKQTNVFSLREEP